MPRLQMKELARHSWDLADLLFNVWYDDPTQVRGCNLLPTAEWLRFAAGLGKVTLDVAAFDISAMYCGAAADYDDRRSQICSAVATSLTRFLFVWSGFESLVDCAFTRSDVKKCGGKVRVAVTQLVASGVQLNGYRESLSALYKLLSTDFRDKSDLRRLTLSKGSDFLGAGLTAVYALRNELAHGGFSFPGAGEALSAAELATLPDVRRIEISCRITLFSMQMLAINLFPDATLETSGLSSIEQDGSELRLGDMLRRVHLSTERRKRSNLKQLTIEELSKTPPAPSS